MSVQSVRELFRKNNREKIVLYSELKSIFNKEMRVKELYEKLGPDVADYNRQSVV